MSNVRSFVQNNMFWLTLIMTLVLFLPLLNQLVGIGTWNLNKTIGWGYDATHLIWLNIVSLSFSLPIFVVGYGLLFITKRKANFALSLTHLFLIVLDYFLLNTNLDILIVLSIAGWLTFLMNLILNEN
jgi:hypothetical protein